MHFQENETTDTAIRRMIKETNGDSFESMRSLEQELSFEATKKEFDRCEVDFGMQQMRSLKMIDADGIYSNLALLLSDQCRHTIKIAVFQGEDQMIFKDRREFEGSLMQQMNDVYEFIDFRNQTHATFEKLLRIDVRDYPEIAVREALLNLLVHRDYSFSASALISMYADRIEFVSIGGLLPGIETEDIMAGISVCRNQNLANVFYRLRLIEAYGTGMGKIMRAYADVSQKPIIENTRNTFKIILPNVNAEKEHITASSYVGESLANFRFETKSRKKGANLLSPYEIKVLEYAENKGMVTKSDVASLLDVSPSTAFRLIKGLLEKNLLMQHGQARGTKYTIAK